LFTVKGIFPIIELGKAFSVRACYVRYTYIGTDYSDPQKRTATKTYYSRLVFVFNGPRADEEIPINAANASTVLSRYFDLAKVESACKPLKDASDARKKAAESQQSAADSKRRIASSVVAQMKSQFVSMYALIIKNTSTDDDYKALRDQDKQSLMSSAAHTAFWEMYSEAAKQSLRSKFSEPVEQGVHMLLKIPINIDH
jgi:hypothetical protein